MRGFLLTAVAGLAACHGGDDTTGLPADSGDGAASNCGTTPPTINSLAITDEGLSTDDSCGSIGVPRIRVTTEAADVDGDLHYWRMRLFWDDVVDGTVSPDGQFSEVEGTIGTECHAFTATLATILCVTGNPVPYSTDLEFGAEIFDDLDHPSNGGVLDVAPFTTPDAHGNY